MGDPVGGELNWVTADETRGGVRATDTGQATSRSRVLADPGCPIRRLQDRALVAHRVTRRDVGAADAVQDDSARADATQGCFDVGRAQQAVFPLHVDTRVHGRTLYNAQP